MHDDEDFDLESYLSSKGVTYRRSGTQLYTQCFLGTCGESERGTSKPGRLYFDNSSPETRGLYHCKLCDARGNYRTLRRHYGDPVEAEGTSNDVHQYVCTAAANAYHDVLSDPDGAVTLDWLRTARGLTNQTIDDHLLGYAPGGRWLFDRLTGLGFESKDIISTGLCFEREGKPIDFFQREVTIPYMVGGAACVQIRGKEMTGKYRTPPGQTGRLFNTNITWGAEEIIVCEGEFDAMVLEQLGFAAVGVPGANIWKDNWNGYFQDVKRVWAMYDPDAAGAQGTERLIAALGPKVKVATPPVPDGFQAKDIDPSFLFVHAKWTREKFEELLRDAAAKSTLLITPAQARQAYEQVIEDGGFKLGYDRFDMAIRPGLLPGDVMIPLAKTNTGKTLFGLNIMQRAAMVPGQEDAKFLYLSMEQMGFKWWDAARRIWNFYHLNCPADKVHDRTEQYWMDRLRIVDKNRLNINELQGVLEDYDAAMGCLPDLLFLDYLGYWVRGAEGNDIHSRTTEAIHSIKELAKDAGIKIIMPHQVNRKAEFGEEFAIDQGRDSGAVEETADYALTMWSTDTQLGLDAKERTGKLNVTIGKSRAGGKSLALEFYLGYQTLVIVPKDEPRNVLRIRNEIDWSTDLRIDWQDAIEHHLTGVMRDLDAPSPRIGPTDIEIPAELYQGSDV